MFGLKDTYKIIYCYFEDIGDFHRKKPKIYKGFTKHTFVKWKWGKVPEYKYAQRAPMTQDEVGEMIEKANRERDACLLAVHYLTGARISEIISLRRGDIRYDEEEISIRFKRRKKRDRGPLLKTDKLILSRTAPFVATIVSYLTDANFDDDDYIFPSPKKEHLTRQRVWQIIKNLNENTSSHFFRHTRLNRLSKKGFSLEDLRKWSGRKTPPVEYMETPEEDIRKIGREVD